MAFIYFVRYQKTLLFSRFYLMENDRTAYNVGDMGARKALAIVDSLFSDYLIETNKSWGLIKSFIPGTNAFKKRLACAEAITLAQNKLDDLVKVILETKQEQFRKVEDWKARQKQDSKLYSKLFKKVNTPEQKDDNDKPPPPPKLMR